jgi:hypothetical protein
MQTYRKTIELSRSFLRLRRAAQLAPLSNRTSRDFPAASFLRIASSNKLTNQERDQAQLIAILS